MPRIGFARDGYEAPEADRTAIDAHLKSTTAPGTWVDAPEVTVDHDPLRLTGRAPGAAQVQLWENGRFLGRTPDAGRRTPVAGDGTWSWSPGVQMTSGEHVVKVLALTAAGADSERTVVHCRVLTPQEAVAAAA